VKPARLVCVFLFLVATLLGQSNPIPLVPRTPQTSELNFASATTYTPGGYYTNSVAVAVVVWLPLSRRTKRVNSTMRYRGRASHS
jgi:hypothetical protein